jgi:hypothetical protein
LPIIHSQNAFFPLLSFSRFSIFSLTKLKKITFFLDPFKDYSNQNLHCKDSWPISFPSSRGWSSFFRYSILSFFFSLFIFPFAQNSKGYIIFVSIVINLRPLLKTPLFLFLMRTYEDCVIWLQI